jgi:hypothetical protein
MPRLVVALALLFALPTVAPAQLSLTLRTGTVVHGAHADAPSLEDSPGFGPASATEFAGAVAWHGAGWRVAATASTHSPDLQLRGETAGVLVVEALQARSYGVEFGRDLVGREAGPRLTGIVGIATDRWKAVDAGATFSRWRGLAALEGGIPLHGKIAAVVRAEAGLAESLFEINDLPEGYDRTTAWRRALQVGLRYGGR